MRFIFLFEHMVYYMIYHMVYYMVYEPMAQSPWYTMYIPYMYTSLVRLAWKQITTDLYSVCCIIHFLAPKVHQKLNPLKEIKQEGVHHMVYYFYWPKKRLTILVNCDTIGISFDIKFGYTTGISTFGWYTKWVKCSSET